MELKIPTAQEITKSIEKESAEALMIEAVEITAAIKKMKNRKSQIVVLEKYDDLSEDIKSELLKCGFKYCRATVINSYGEVSEGFAILAIPS